MTILKEHVSYSEIRQWKECPWRHKLLYLDKLRTFEESPHLHYGTIIHDACEHFLKTKELKIEVLGERLNKALTSKVFELQKYRSEFFGKLKSLLGERDDIKIVGDRFIFESELLFDSASADLQLQGMDKLKQIGLTLKETTNQIPSDIDWIIQVEGHTDKRPINTVRYPSNWELSTARGSSVVRNIISQGVDPTRLVAAGYADWVPRGQAGNLTQKIDRNTVLELNDTPEKKGRNRRIEITFLKPAHHTTSYVENEG